MRLWKPLLVLVALGVPSAVRAEDPAPKPGAKFEFGRDIRPILSDKCFTCHGPDDAQRKADLRLDRQESALQMRAIVPGKVEESELFQRITSKDPEEVMPPPKHGKPLTQEEVDKLRGWIEQGASYSRHWAFVPPRKVAPPVVADSEFVRNTVDRFVRAKLDSLGLKPSPEADRATLLRRLSLDLIGLPPTLSELERFLSDADPRAYEREVERLLNSPHYGERWARIWLDAARYADSDGYEKDKLRFVWFYRDWVIRAFNQDMPYDRFIIEQIAGDLLPNATQDQIVATGFLRNSMINEEGGVDPEQFRMEAMFDRMDAVGKAILGLTIQCAQCHSHKYDPLTQEEYYRMFAFLNNSDESSVEVFTNEQQRLRDEIARETNSIEDELRRRTPDWESRMGRWIASIRDDQPDWSVVTPSVDDISTGGSKYLPLPDGSLLAQGYAPTKHTVKLTLKTPLERITALRLELLNDPNLPRGGPGRSIFGTGALSEISIQAVDAADPSKSVPVKIASATADIQPPERPNHPQFDDRGKAKRVTGPIAFAVDGKDETAWTHDAGPGFRNNPAKAVFVFEKPLSSSGGVVLTVSLAQKHGGWNSDDNQNCNLGRMRLSLTSAEKPVADPLPNAVRSALELERERRSDEQQRAIFSYWRTTVAEWKPENDRIAKLRESYPDGTSQLVLHDRLEAPRSTSMLNRGNFLDPTKRVDPGVPGFLHSLDGSLPANRRGFAGWLASRESPTTARAIVNRIWQAYFGTGLSATSEDLGSKGELPTHPELLDWLAVDLMENNWSLKSLHRTIVTSSTYRQSSTLTPELREKDPENRLLARGPRFRVDAEIVRDIALSIGGLLDQKVGGPSVFPPAPSFLFQPPISYGPKVWDEAKGVERYRRALYTFRYRSVPYPALQTFDAPNGDFACVKRARSNTPLQALTTLNEPLFLDAARGLAAIAMAHGKNDHDRIEFAFRRTLARRPSDTERSLLLRLLEQQSERFARPDAKPWELAASDPSSPPVLPAGESPARLAAWTAVARVLLNLDETITKE
ncbi:MAG: PSD1 and planctomycete cytochrome C domain-containing protein [Isosphaeraceae bacterium]|nr:PSD1 and planctomycete cytochrome C domain-containing protein [Isosphaeraceae bacterium]